MSQINNALISAVKAGAYGHAARYLRLLRQNERVQMPADEVTTALWTIALSTPFGYTL